MNLTIQDIKDLQDAVAIAKQHTPMFTAEWVKLDRTGEILLDLLLAT